MKWILHPIKSFREWKDRRYLKQMIAEAKRMHLITKKQYHVVPLEGGKLEVVDNHFLKSYNKPMKSLRDPHHKTMDHPVTQSPQSALGFFVSQGIRVIRT